MPTETASLEVGGVVFRKCGKFLQVLVKCSLIFILSLEVWSIVLRAGAQPAGEMVFRWDGLNAEINGELIDWQSQLENGAPSGQYQIEVTTRVDGTENTD